MPSSAAPSRTSRSKQESRRPLRCLGSIALGLTYEYGVRRIIGFRSDYERRSWGTPP
jgi:hypothetical protein